MLLYIVRHAEAEPAVGVPKTSDSLRLTPDGKRAMAHVAFLAARELGFHPDVVVSSPMARAVETARIVRTRLHMKSGDVVDEALAWDRPPRGVYSLVRGRKDAESVAIVTHVPLIPRLLADALGGPARVNLLRGGIACVQFEKGVGPDRGTLLWVLPPQQWFDGLVWE